MTDIDPFDKILAEVAQNHAYITETKRPVIKKPSNQPQDTRVVRIQRKNGRVIQDCDVYIGRRQTQGGWNLSESKWHNPYKVSATKTVALACAEFKQYLLYKRPDLIAAIKQGELNGKVLGCWCKVKPTDPCHGDVLVELVKLFHN